MYDIIGDIHGYYEHLVILLNKLGYKEVAGNWHHPQKRKVIFVGDYIDREPQILEVVRLVRSMTGSGNAIALMGNHEFNALAYNIKNHDGDYCRSHNEAHIKQHQESLTQIKNYKTEWKSHLDWFLTLPLFWEDENMRAVHACWDNNIIERLKELLNGNFFTSKKDIITASEKGSELYELTEITLKGKEIALPAEVTFYDKDNNLRSDIRIKWWKDPKNMTWKNYSINIIPELPSFPPESKHDFYRLDEKPVFFGHYWLTGTSELLQPNVCCLDSSVAKGGQLVAFKKNGKIILLPDYFVEVRAEKEEV